MFFRKITSRSNGKEYTYLKLIENYREGDKVKQRVVANLGSMENLTPEKVHGLIAGLSRICGVSQKTTHLEAKKVLRYGEILAIHKIWETLKVSAALEKAIAHRKTELNIPLLVKLMAMNQIIKPQNKQAIIDWYQCLYLPELEGKELQSHHFYRALDLLSEIKDDAERNIFNSLASLFPVDTGLSFCRLTTTTFEPAPRQELTLSSYGRYILDEPRELKKVEFGLFVSRDGMPFGHKVIGEEAGEGEFNGILQTLKADYGVNKCIFVGERNIMSNTGLEVLVALGYNYLIGRKVWAKQDRELLRRELIHGNKGFREFNEDLWFKEVRAGDIRFLLCYNHRIAGQRQDYLERKLAREQNLAGVFLLETNSNDLNSEELLESYVNLARLGEIFQEVKNFEIKPNQLYTELKITANIFVCVLAAMLEKTMERMIRRAGIGLNSRQVLELLEEIKVTINQLGDREVKSVTMIPKVQEEILQAIGVGHVQRTII